MYIYLYQDHFNNEIFRTAKTLPAARIGLIGIVNDKIKKGNLAADYEQALRSIKTKIKNSEGPVVLTLDDYGQAFEIYAAREYEDLIKFIQRTTIEEIKSNPELLNCRYFGELHEVCDANELGGICHDDHPLNLYHLQFMEQNGLNRVQDYVDLWLRCYHANHGGMTFVEFRSLGVLVNSETMPMHPATFYRNEHDEETEFFAYNVNGCYVYIDKLTEGPKRYSLTVDRRIYHSNDLEELERRLFLYCVDEGIVEDTRKFQFVPIEGSQDMSPQTVDFTFFSVFDGFEREQISAINQLAPGDQYECNDGIGQLSLVIRIA